MRAIVVTGMLIGLAGCAEMQRMLPGSAEPPLEITSTHAVPGASPQVACTRARDWMASSFKEVQPSPVGAFNADAGSLSGTGLMTLAGYQDTYPVRFNVSARCTPGQVVVQYTGFRFLDKGSERPVHEDTTNRLRAKSEAQVRELDAGLKAALARR